MNFIAFFIFGFFVSVCLVFAAAVLGIWLGWLPGVDYPFARKKSVPSQLRWSYEKLTYVNTLIGIRTTNMEFNFELSKDPIFIFIFASSSDNDVILGKSSPGRVNPILRSLGDAYRYENGTDKQLPFGQENIA